MFCKNTWKLAYLLGSIRPRPGLKKIGPFQASDGILGHLEADEVRWNHAP